MITYLKATQTGTLNASGNVTITNGPPVGQYWFPTFMTVGTLLQSAPFAACTVYEGQSGVLDQTTYVDDTLYGYRDTSSIIAGSEVQYGETYTAQFTGGNPGDTAIFTVYGLMSDQPVGTGPLIPSTPGVQFRGHSVVINQIVVPLTPLVSLNNGAGTNISTSNMRAYNSFNLKVFCNGPVTPTGFNGCTVTLVWQDSAQQINIKTQSWQIGANQSTAAFSMPGGVFEVHDVCHSDILLVTMNAWGPDTIQVHAQVDASSRPVGMPYAEELQGQGFRTATSTSAGERGLVLVEGQSVAANTTVQYATFMAEGLCTVYLFVAGGGPVNINGVFGEEIWQPATPFPPVSQGVTASTYFTYQIYVPRAPVIFTLKNTNVSTASTISLRVVNQRTIGTF